MAKKRNGKPRRNAWRRRSRPGDAPGQINVDPNANPTKIRVIGFGGGAFLEREIKEVSEIRSVMAQAPKIWIDVIGLGSERTLQALGELLELHPLALEDVVNVHQRAKVDDFENSIFIIARMIDVEDSASTEQLAFFLKENLLISCQERPGDCWDPLRQRIRQQRPNLVDSGVDYLLHSLLDAVIDSYFPAIDRIVEQVDALELEIIESVESNQMQKVHELRGQLLAIRRAIRPHREMVNELIRDPKPTISAETRVHLRDCYDHVIQVIDTVDTYRELTSDIRDFYLSSVSNNMNEVMKVLTIISTIFIPLSFIAGVYGMNFSSDSPWNMPELYWRYGYLFALGLMALVAGALLVYFRRRRWI
ncbi:MAG: magnesium/cobalt transporter CorA [Planctomycetota bacterium]